MQSHAPPGFLPALHSRNYRLFFAGQGVSLIGTWMTQIATVWLVYHLTQSVFMLGVVGFTSQIPNFVMSPWGGVLVDRLSPHRVLISTQVLAMIQSLSLAALALSGTIEIWHILALSLVQGLINAVDAPARQVFVIELLERREDLANAIAINSTLFNGARLVGPAIGGLLIAQVGEAYCFLIDGLSYIAVIMALLAMRFKPKPLIQNSGSLVQEVKKGLIYAFSCPPIRAILLLSSLTSFAGMQYTVFVPLFADEILRGNAQTLGFLMAASGVGALLGGIYLATRQTVIGLGKVMLIAPALLGVGLISFSLSRFLPLSLLSMLLIGLGTILQIAAGNTILQTIVDDDKRGRVMSLYTMSFLGITPFGSLFAGTLASWIGATNTLLIAGAICFLGALIFSRQFPGLREIVRNIYIKKGILPLAEP
jgi:MFS family permease